MGGKPRPFGKHVTVVGVYWDALGLYRTGDVSFAGDAAPDGYANSQEKGDISYPSGCNKTSNSLDGASPRVMRWAIACLLWIMAGNLTRVARPMAQDSSS